MGEKKILCSALRDEDFLILNRSKAIDEVDPKVGWYWEGSVLSAGYSSSEQLSLFGGGQPSLKEKYQGGD
jgi:hypothetical protein